MEGIAHQQETTTQVIIKKITNETHTQEDNIMTQKNKFEKLEQKYNIHFQEEWKDYYVNREQIRLEQLGPFGPHDWNCIKLESIEELCQPYSNGNDGRHQNHNYIDIAIRSYGMGHYLVLSMTKDGLNFFFRDDGGSNGYERMANLQKFDGWNPTLYQPLYSVSQVMELLQVDLGESFDTLEHFLEKHCQKGDKSKINYDAM